MRPRRLACRLATDDTSFAKAARPRGRPLSSRVSRCRWSSRNALSPARSRRRRESYVVRPSAVIVGRESRRRTGTNGWPRRGEPRLRGTRGRSIHASVANWLWGDWLAASPQCQHVQCLLRRRGPCRRRADGRLSRAADLAVVASLGVCVAAGRYRDPQAEAVGFPSARHGGVLSPNPAETWISLKR